MSSGPLPPTIVEYDKVTGVPSEFNEYLPQESLEYKTWKAAQEGPEALEKLKLKDNHGNEIERQLPGGKVKKKQKPEIVLEVSTRNKKKSITTITGLDSFKVKLSEAAKLFGKKFATGSSVVKTADGKEQIDMQGDFVGQVADLIMKNFGKLNNISHGDIYFINEDKKKELYYGEEEEDD